MTTAMSPRFSFHAQLSAIMETMVKTTFPQVCKLVEQDSFELRTELSRLKVANAALVEKLYSLEKELLLARSEAAKLHKSCRTVGVQAGDSSRETESPTIEGVFGKDWCMGLWKDRNTRSLERVGSSTQCSNKSMVPFSNEITVIEVKEDYVAGSCPQETLRLNIGEHEESLAHETEEPSIEYSPEIGNFSLSLDPEEEEVVSAGVPPGKPSMQLRSINDDDICSPHVIPISEDQEEEEVVSAGVPPGEPSLQLRSINDDDICSPHVIPISEDSDDDDDVEFIEVSEQPTLPADSKNDTAPDRGAHDNFNDSSSNKDRLTCKICNHTFVHKRTLTRHMKSHKSNYCQICKQSFKKNQLKQHKCEPPVRTSMTCEWCGKAFKNPSSLMVHSRVHSGETPHTCTVCGKGFGQKGNLKIHLRIHTGEKPFQCVTCGKTFTQKSSLTSHLTSHRKEAAKRQTPSAQPVKT